VLLEKLSREAFGSWGGSKPVGRAKKGPRLKKRTWVGSQFWRGRLCYGGGGKDHKKGSEHLKQGGVGKWKKDAISTQKRVKKEGGKGSPGG